MPVEIKILMDDAGRIGVSGPLENTLLCYGLLKAGEIALQDHYRKQAERLVQPATIVPSFKLD
jgi:hypothetical protein